MMDVEKLIEQLSIRGLGNGTSLGYHSGLLDESATALYALQVENEKLRAELEQVKAERDAAVSDMETIMAYGGGNLDTCQYCKNGQCYARGGTKLCLPEWRGPQKED